MENQALYSDIFAKVLSHDTSFLDSEMKRYAKTQYNGSQCVYWTVMTVANLAYYALYSPPEWRVHFVYEYSRLMTYIEFGPHTTPGKYISCHK